MALQTLCVPVPIDYDCPLILKETTPEDNAFILTLGCKALALIRSEGHAKTHKEVLQSLQAKAKEDFVHEKQALEKLITQSKSELALATDRFQAQLAAAKAQIESLQTTLAYESSSKNSIAMIVRQEEKQNREELMKEKDQRIQHLERDLAGMLKSIETGVHSFRDQFLKVTNASNTKGKTQENIFADLLTRTYGSSSIEEEFHIEMKGNEAHSGDIQMRWRGGKILWEVKNYTKPVDKKETLKFQEDMRTNSDMDLGVFVSLNTPIVGHSKAGDIDLEVLQDGRLCLYLNNFNTHQDAQAFLQSLQPFLEIFLKQRKKTETPDSSEVELLKRNAKVLLIMLQTHQGKMTDMKMHFQTMKKKIDTLWLEHQTKLRDTEQGVRLMLQTLLEGSEEEDESQMAVEETAIFKDYCWETLDAFEQKFITVLRKQFKISEDAKILAKEVREALASAGLTEKQQDRARESLLREDVWPKGSKDVRYLQKI